MKLTWKHVCDSALVGAVVAICTGRTGFSYGEPTSWSYLDPHPKSRMPVRICWNHSLIPLHLAAVVR
jgi:hypothetical protein